MVKRFIIVALLLAIIFGGFVGFDMFRKKMMAEFFAGMKPPPATVSSTIAEKETIPNLLEGIGSIDAVRSVIVSPEVGGRITNIEFEAGAEVNEGDLLVELNYAPEMGDLGMYQAHEKLAQQNLDRTEKLIDIATARSTVDQYRSELESARATIARIEAVIEQKRIKAPFSGVLGIRQVNLGQYVSPGQAIVSLTDLSDLYVNFTLPEQNRADIAVGQDIRLSVDAWPGRIFNAKVSAIEPQIGEDTRVMKVQGRLSNADGVLNPGMFARVTVELPSDAHDIVLPETSVQFSIYGDSVFVVSDAPAGENADQSAATDAAPQQIAKRVYVKTGRRFNNKVQITEGLDDGVRVITSGQVKLSDGAPVILSDRDAITDDYKARGGEAGNP